MKKYILCLSTILISFQFFSCKEKDKSEKTTNIEVKTEDTINFNKTFELKEAHAKDLVAIKANGLGTFRELEIFVLNKSAHDLKLNVPSGLFFENPDSNAQSLLTCKKIGNIEIKQNDSFKLKIASVCTNVQLHIPGFLKNWKFIPNYKGGIDEILSFYGNHEFAINTWLKKKNPEKFETETQRQLFLQVVIWAEEGGNYAQILAMLKNDVFQGDINKAKEWLDSIYNEAREIAGFIKKKDSEGLKKWCKKAISDILPKKQDIKKGINNSIEKLKNKLN